MANIDRIVNVQISLNTAGLTQESFSTLLIVGPHVHSLARVETYTDANDMLTDGFSESDPLYIAAADAFSQTPRPSAIKIGRRAVPSVKITPASVVTNGVYTLTVSTKDSDGNVTTTPYTHTNSSGSSADAITAAIAQAISDDSDAKVTATNSNGVLTITGPANTPYVIRTSSLLTVENGAVTESVADTMAAIVASDDDWYGWAITSRESADILAAAEWTEANRKLFGTAIAEAGAIDADVSTDTGSQLMAKNYYRTFWYYHAEAANEFPEAAVMARCFSVLPGGETWANKRLSSITADGLTETQFNAVKAKNGNTFEKFRNITITQRGVVAGGEWIDVIRFRDWLQEEITVNVFNALVNADKIPYTDAGIAIIENQIRAALQLGQDRNGIAPNEYDADGNQNLGYTVSVPLSAGIAANTKASRILNDVKFTARLAGAIHVVNITGSLTYENLIVASAG